MNALTSLGTGGNSWAADSFVSGTGFRRCEPLGLHYNAYIMLYCKKVGAVGKSPRAFARALSDDGIREFDLSGINHQRLLFSFQQINSIYI